MTLSERFLLFASKLIPSGSKVLVALSGGADSVCLLSLISQCQDEMGLLRVSAAHYHHGLRAAADSDADLARAISDKLGVDFHIGYGDVPAEVKRQKRGIEETARQMRYSYLYEIAQNEGYTHIATAHTADDNLETVVLNMLRGAGLDGMRGILPTRADLMELEESPAWGSGDSARSIPVVRPLLEFTRADVETAIRLYNLFYVNDESNLSLDYTRNRIRHTVLPALQSIQPLAVERSVVMVTHLREDAMYLNEVAVSAFNSLIVPFDSDFSGYADDTLPSAQVCLDALSVSGQPPAIASRIFRHWWLRVTGSTEGLTSSHVSTLIYLSKSPDPHAKASLPSGVTAWRNFSRIYMGKPRVSAAPPATPVLLPCDGTVISDFPGWQISCRKTEYTEPKPNCFPLRNDAVYGAIKVCLRGEGEHKFAPVGRPTRPLKKWLSESQMSLEARETLPLVVDDLGLLLLPGLGVDRRVEPLEGDSVFEVTLIHV